MSCLSRESADKTFIIALINDVGCAATIIFCTIVQMRDLDTYQRGLETAGKVRECSSNCRKQRQLETKLSGWGIRDSVGRLTR